MNKNTQISKGRLSRLLGWLPHHGNPSKPNKSAVLEREPNCSIDLNLAVTGTTLGPGVSERSLRRLKETVGHEPNDTLHQVVNKSQQVFQNLLMS